MSDELEQQPTYDQLHRAWAGMRDEIEDLESDVVWKVADTSRLLGIVDELQSGHERLLAHLSRLDYQHGLLEGLYEWDHDTMGYKAGRTCQTCGVRSSKHARLDARHTDDCHLRAVEEALGITQLGVMARPDMPENDADDPLDGRLEQIAEYARRQAAHHEDEGLEGLARPWRHVVALATDTEDR